MNPVDSFLSRLATILAELPEERRQEILAETRGHLECMLAARKADGMLEAEAWADVECAFGEPEMVGREIAREWNRNPRMETEGTPLTMADHARNLNRMFLTKAPGGLGLLALLTLLQRNGLGPVFYCAFGPLASAWVIWIYRKHGRPITASVGLTCLFLMIVSFGMTGLISSELFSYLVVGSMVLAAIASKREAKKVRSWHWLPAYKQNPIGAEEEYRFSTLHGGIYGLVMGCVMVCWMRWEFLGLGVGVVIWAACIAVIYLFSRWAERRAA